MGEEKYILQIHESILMPKEKKDSTDIIRKIVGTIVIILLVASFVFGENLFSELNILAQVFLIALFLKFVVFTDGKIDALSPLEIIFYDDVFVVHRPKIWRGNNCIRKETDIMRYDEVKRIKYVSESKRFQIYGTFSGKYFKYKRSGDLEDKPCYDRTVKEGMIYFSTRGTDENDNHIVDVLKTYFPNKLEIK